MTQTEDDALNQRIRDRAAAIAEEEREGLTLAQRLMVSALDQTIDVNLSGVTVQIYAPFAEEVDAFLVAARRGDSAGICSMLAGICVDPSLDEEFFKSGAMSHRDLKTLTEAICGMDEQTTRTIDRFRRERSR